jgi:beta-glucosidase
MRSTLKEMAMPRRRLLVLALLAATSVHAADKPRPWMNTSLSPDKRADLVMAQLTQDEKFRLIRSEFGDNEKGKPQKPAGALGSAGYTPAIERLGIPAVQETDAGLGVRSPGLTGKGATALPAGLAVAATFDPAIAYAGGAMIGSQARRKGFNGLLAGGIDLVRDPRNGRNFEYAGEDPILAGTIVGNAIKGIQSQHIISTIKHYAINALETGRNTLSADIDETALRESDLLAFEIAIGIGQPASVMCSYNRINTVYACEHPWLLNTVLKQDWGYKGYVMSDWGGVHSSAAAANAGLDQESAGNVFDDQVYFDAPLRKDLADGKVPQARIDDMVHRILRSMFASGVIDHPVKAAPINFNADAVVARKAAEAGSVLLRNENDLLPLSATVKSVAVIGNHADKGVITGGGSSSVEPPEGNAVPGLEPTEWPGPVRYQPSAPLAAINAQTGGKAKYADGNDIAAAAKLAAESEVAVVFVQQWTAESFDPATMALDGNQDALVAAVARANPKTIVVIQNNGPVKMPWLSKVGAVLDVWYAGARGGEAIGNLLFGKVGPSGRLPVTWPKDESQLPRPVIVGGGFPSGKPADKVDYNIEGADVGYRWFQKKNLTPLFPFGYGLTYTSFDYSAFKVRQVKGEVMADVTVKNTGKRAGIDVPQLYVTLPDGTPRRLAGWERVSLKPGQSLTVHIRANPHALARYKDGWKVAAGAYHFELGHSATSFAGDATLSLPEANVGTAAR